MSVFVLFFMLAELFWGKGSRGVEQKQAIIIIH